MHFLRSLTCLATVTLGALLRAAPADWAFTPVATVGADGFTSVVDARVGDNGTIVVHGVRDGLTGLFLVTGGAATTVVTEGTVLPDELGVVSLISSDFAVDPSGRVVFSARVSGGSLPASSDFRVFRSEAGVITRMLPGDGFTHAPRAMASDGRWVVERITGTFPNQTHVVHLTDGATATEVFTFARTGANCRFENNTNLTPNAAGSILFHHAVQSSEFFSDGRGGGRCGVNEAFTRTWDFSIAGPGATVVTSGGRVVTQNADTGTESVQGIGLLNDAGAVAWRREVYAGAPLFFGDGNPPANIQLVLKDASGERVLVDTLITDAARLDQLMGLDPVGRVAFTTRHQSTSELRLFSGPDLAHDRVLGRSDTLFGSALRNFSPLAVSAPSGTFGDKRVFLFAYTLDDAARTTGIASASKQVTRWANTAGGAWSSGSNWSPAVVPASAVAAAFDLEASYDVSVGTRTVGRVMVENGSVGFQSIDLTLTGPLFVGGDSTLTMPGGSLHADEIIVGHLPPPSVSNEPTARFNASDRTLSLVVDKSVVVGQAGHGEMSVTQGIVLSSELRVGSGSDGTVNLGMDGTEWVVSGSVAIGHTSPGVLHVERGAFLDVGTSLVIGAGATASSASGDGETRSSQDPAGTTTMDAGDADFVGGWVIVDNAGSTVPPDLGNIFVRSGALTVGGQLPGQLEIRHGGLVAVAGSSSPSIQTAQHDRPDVVAEARIMISGTGASAAQPSQLLTLGDAALGLAAETVTVVRIEDGGGFSVFKNLTLAEVAGSTANILLEGVADNGARSTLEVLSDQASGERLVIGRRGRSTVTVRDGALLAAKDIFVGQAAGSSGTLFVGGRARGQIATVEVTSTSSSFIGGILVGGSRLAGGDDSAPGELLLSDALVKTPSLSVAPAGAVRGSGTIEVGTMLELGGTLDPAIDLQPTPAGARLGAQAQGVAAPARDAEGGVIRAQADAAPIRPSTITIQGNLVMKPTGRVKLDVLGSAPDAADRLVVTGALTLGGTLEIAFANGYAPKAGDTLALIRSTSTTGSFANTTVAGLEPGFQFSLAPDGSGGVRLTAVNDGVAATSVGSRLSNLSVRTALADAQNLIVGFIVSGGAKPVLVRAAGPGLATMVDGTHPDPRIALFNSAGNAVDSNDDWPDELAATMQALGAFPFAPASTDAALLRSANAAYTAHVNGPGSGIVLVELYDAQTGVSPRLINASARNRVGAGADILIAGFVIEGSSPKTVLVRGVGPGLAGLDVTGTLADPLLTVFEGGSPRDQNDDWPAELAGVFTRVGAFELPAGSKDAALLVTLAPGIYTAQVSGVGATTGEALVEVYEVP